MARFILINSIAAGGRQYHAGQRFDEAYEAAEIAHIQAVGGVLWPDTDPIVAAVATKADTMYLRGGAHGVDLMVQAAVAASLKASIDDAAEVVEVDPFADSTDPRPVAGATGAYTEGAFTYDSSIDAAVTNLDGKYCYDNGLAALGLRPVLIVLHGYTSSIAAISQVMMRRFASYGFLAVAASRRNDSAGRNPHDAIDCLAAVRALLPSVADPDRAIPMGYSGGGAQALALAVKSPDLWTVFVSNFGISDPGYDSIDGWWATRQNIRPTLIAEIGDRETVINPYRARDSVAAIAKALRGGGFLYLNHDAEDGDVSVANSRRVVAAMQDAGLTNFLYTETSDATEPVRYEHGYPDDYPDLILGEFPWVRRGLGEDPWTVPARGTFRVNGWIKTKRFEIWTGPTSTPRVSASGGIDEVVDVEYDTLTAIYRVTPLTGTCYVQITQGARSTSLQVSAPTEIQLNGIAGPISGLGDIPGLVAHWRSSLGVTQSGDVSAWLDQVGGISLAGAGPLPNYVADLDGGGFPAVHFTAASSERLVAAAPAIDWAGDYTIIGVLKPGSSGTTGHSLVASNNANNTSNYLALSHQAGIAAYHTFVDSAGAAGQAGVANASAALHFFCWRAQGALLRVQCDGNVEDTDPRPSGGITVNTLTLGGRTAQAGVVEFYDTDQVEWAIYDNSLSDNDVARARTYLKTQYSPLP